MKRVFYFKHESYGDDWNERDSHAIDLEKFAEEVAEKYWSDDPSDPNNFEFDVEVKRGEFGTSIKFKVTAESYVNFYAREKK